MKLDQGGGLSGFLKSLPALSSKTNDLCLTGESVTQSLPQTFNTAHGSGGSEHRVLAAFGRCATEITGPDPSCKQSNAV